MLKVLSALLTRFEDVNLSCIVNRVIRAVLSSSRVCQLYECFHSLCGELLLWFGQNFDCLSRTASQENLAYQLVSNGARRLARLVSCGDLQIMFGTGLV